MNVSDSLLQSPMLRKQALRAAQALVEDLHDFMDAEYGDHPVFENIDELDPLNQAILRERFLFVENATGNVTILDELEDASTNTYQSALLTLWKERFTTGVFKLIARKSGAVLLYSLVEDTTHLVLVSEDLQSFWLDTALGSWVFTTLVPLHDMWHCVGFCCLVRASGVADALEDVREHSAICLMHNPEILQQSLDATEAQHTIFVEEFGATFLCGTPTDVLEHLERIHVRLEEEALFGDEEREHTYLMNFLEHCSTAATIGLFSHPVTGLDVQVNAGRLLEAFHHPEGALTELHASYVENKIVHEGPIYGLELLFEEHPDKFKALVGNYLSHISDPCSWEDWVEFAYMNYDLHRVPSRAVLPSRLQHLTEEYLARLGQDEAFPDAFLIRAPKKKRKGKKIN